MLEKIYSLFSSNSESSFLSLSLSVITVSCIAILFIWILTLFFSKFVDSRSQRPIKEPHTLFSIFIKIYAQLLRKSLAALRIVLSINVILLLIDTILKSAALHIQTSTSPLISPDLKITAVYFQKTADYIFRFSNFLLITFAVVLVAVWVIRILENVSEKLITRTEAKANIRQKSRNKTLNIVIGNFLKVVISIVAIFTVLQNIGINITTLLATAGVVSVAFGLGAQTLMKDLIAGFVLLFEDQFAVGDEVEINSYAGKIEGMTLRIVRLRNKDGGLTIISNGDIRTVRNYSAHP